MLFFITHILQNYVVFKNNLSNVEQKGKIMYNKIWRFTLKKISNMRGIDVNV